MSPEDVARIGERLRGRQLRLILAIGEQGTLRQAAAAIYVTQPTATKILSELEALFGVPLYDRGPRGLTATPYGCDVLAFAVRVSSEFERLLGTLNARRTGGVGELTVGAILGTTADVIAEAVAGMKADHPYLTIRLRGETSETLLSMLERKTIDVAVGRFSHARLRDGIQYEPLGEEALCIAARSGHPLAGHARLTLAEIAGQRWVMHSMSNPARQLLNAEFEKAGIAPPRDIIEADSILTVFKILGLSDAIAFLSEPLTEDQIRGGLLCKLPVGIDVRLSNFGLATRRSDPLTGATAEFADRIRKIALQD